MGPSNKTRGVWWLTNDVKETDKIKGIKKEDIDHENKKNELDKSIHDTSKHTHTHILKWTKHSEKAKGNEKYVSASFFFKCIISFSGPVLLLL